jgi:hypothetical protein
LPALHQLFAVIDRRQEAAVAASALIVTLTPPMAICGTQA